MKNMYKFGSNQVWKICGKIVLFVAQNAASLIGLPWQTNITFIILIYSAFIYCV